MSISVSNERNLLQDSVKIVYVYVYEDYAYIKEFLACEKIPERSWSRTSQRFIWFYSLTQNTIDNKTNTQNLFKFY